MKIALTDIFVPTTELESLCLYNGLDCTVPQEVAAELHSQADANAQLVYRFEMALRGPFLAMMLRGIKIDAYERNRVIASLRLESARMERLFATLCEAVKKPGINPRANLQLHDLFYTHLHLPVQFTKGKGTRRPTLDREALEALEHHHPVSEALIKTLLALRDTQKKLSTLLSAVDSDGRMRTSLNIGKETGRISSSRSAFGTGTNLQNISTKDWQPRNDDGPEVGYDENHRFAIRRVFIADPGYKFAYADLERAESLTVAMLARDRAYIEAHRAKDMHAYVAGMVFGLAESKVREIAFHGFSFRDLAKRAAHATNYLVSAWTLSRYLKLPIRLCEEFQWRYHSMFPGIKPWQDGVALTIQTTGRITTQLGRTRQFFGRLTDDATVREAVAYEPQSIVADVLNVGLLRTFERFEQPDSGLQILLPVHDAILCQYREKNESLLQDLKQCMLVTVPTRSGPMTIPVDIKVGYNWHDMVSLEHPNAAIQSRGPALLDRLVF